MKEELKIKLANYAFLAAIIISVASSFLPINFPNYTVLVLYSQFSIALPFIVLFIMNKVKADPSEKVTYAKEVNMRKIKPAAVILTVLLAFLIQPVLAFFNALSLVFTTSTTSSSIFAITKGMPFWGAALLIAALPAFMEETVYRGLLYRPLRAANPWKAVILTGFCFGLMHGNLNQFMYAFVMGIVFALVNEATGSILSSMIIHFISNFLSVIQLYMLPKVYEMAQYLYQYMLEHQEENAQYGEAISMLEQSLGDLTSTPEAWINSMMSEAANAHLGLGTVIATYLPSAVLFGFISFFVLRTISRQSGTWNNFRHVFLGAENPIVEAETVSTYGTEREIPEDKEKGTPGLRVLTIPMMLAIALGIVFMFIYETLKLLPQG